ncbi:hypothetical protein M569_06505, partial [Genlisea aurea]
AAAGRKDRSGEKDENINSEIESSEESLVCVTSGVSYLGMAIVNQLRFRGYSVRIIVDNEEDLEKLTEIDGGAGVELAVAKFGDVESLVRAFHGAVAVFHTAGFVDPSGISGYTKSMVEVEVKGTENVMRASEMSGSVRYCVLTSSLVACVWRDDDRRIIIDHNSWSDHSYCAAKKLWYALGKLKMEKAATEMAQQLGLKLGTICCGLIRDGPHSIAYLKGAREMYARGVVAAVDDVRTLAEAHALVFEEMKKKKNGSGSGRYVWYDRVIEDDVELRKLGDEAGVDLSRAATADGGANRRFRLSKARL